MGINIADNFAYNGKKPMDNRTEYATLSAMKAVVDANINEGCLAYNKEDGKYYKFLSTNTVDATTGKWREFETGGGGQTYNDFTGATSSTAGAHGLVPAPSAGDENKVLFGSGAWGALPSVDMSVLSNEANILSTTEKVVGQWTNGKLLYQKTIDCGAMPSTSGNKNVSISSLGIDELVGIKAYAVHTTDYYLVKNIPYSYSSNDLVVWGNRDNLTFACKNLSHADWDGYATIHYTKANETALASDEKYAGLTSAGEVIYEKTITPSSPFQFGTTSAWTNVVAVDNAINGIISVDCYDSGSLRNPPVLFKPDNGYLQYWNIDNNSNLQYYTISKFVVRYTKTS